MAVSPAKLSTQGGDQLTITGGPFSTTTNFFINNQLANVMSVTATTAVLLTPARAGIGPVSIVARNPDGQSSSNSNAAMSPTAFTFYASQIGFSQATYPTQAALPHGVALGDLNGDGKTDAIVTHLNSAIYTVFLGNGLGSFAPLQPTSTFNYGPSGSGANNTTNLLDLNGDGKLDLFLGTNGNQIVYYLGNGTGLMNQIAQVLANTSGNVFSQVAVDFNGDKLLDMVTANVNASNIGLFVNTGANAGLYSGGQYMVLNPGGQPTRVQTADVNGT
jgi:hypothetical protein